MVAGAELLGQVRGRVHRDRRADQDLRVSGVLRDAAVQRVQRFPAIRGAAAADVVDRRLPGVSVRGLEGRRRTRDLELVVGSRALTFGFATLFSGSGSRGRLELEVEFWG